MNGGVDETVDVKEVGNGAEENGNANVNDELAEGEKKETLLPLSGDQENQESTVNVEARTAGIDNKEVVNDADENGNANLIDESAEGEMKETLSPLPANQETQESTEKDEVMTTGKDNVAEDTVVEATVEAEIEEKEQSPEAEKEKKEQIPEAEKIVDVPDVTSAEATGDDDAGKVNGTKENGNMEIDANGNHDDYSDVKFKSEDNIAKQNEDDRANVLKEGKIEDSGEVKDDKSDKELNDEATNMDDSNAQFEELDEPKLDEDHEAVMNTPNKSFLDGYDSGTEEEQAEFAEEVKAFYRENNLEYKAPKFYKEDLNLLKLWRSVIKLGGYDQVSSCKLWRQVGESFRPPKTCTTVSWTFRIFYEKALLEYERHKMRNGELPFSDDSFIEPVRVDNQVPGSQALGSGRARRDAAARAMQGWHSQRLLGNGEVSEPIIKDKNLSSAVKGKTNGLLKRKKPSSVERDVNAPHMKSLRMDSSVVDIGPPADWVKINVQKTSDCYEIYALVPGLLREEVHVQSDPAGRVVISGEPEKPDNPWGVTPFKKVVSLPTRIDPHQTSAVVTLHGQLFVRVPFEQLDS